MRRKQQLDNSKNQKERNMATQVEAKILREERIRIPTFAHELGCSIPKARGLVRRKVVDSFKIGRTVLIPASEVGRILRDGFRPRQDSENEK